MEISFIIVNCNTKELLRNCLNSIGKTITGISHEIIVVDNASQDGSVAMLRREFPAAHAIENKVNRGFGAANNQALSIMKGRYALLLNTDALLTENAVSLLFSFMEGRPDTAMAFGQILKAHGARTQSLAAFPSLLTLMTNIS